LKADDLIPTEYCQQMILVVVEPEFRDAKIYFRRRDFKRTGLFNST